MRPQETCVGVSGICDFFVSRWYMHMLPTGHKGLGGHFRRNLTIFGIFRVFGFFSPPPSHDCSAQGALFCPPPSTVLGGGQNTENGGGRTNGWGAEHCSAPPPSTTPEHPKKFKHPYAASGRGSDLLPGKGVASGRGV